MGTTLATKFISTALLGATVAGAGYGIAPAISASKTVHTTKFNINFGSIRIGKLNFTIKIDGEEYTLNANGKTDGVARMFSKGKGSFESRGHFDNTTVISSSHKVQVTERGKTAKLSMAFDDGDLVEVSANPKKKNGQAKTIFQFWMSI